MIKNQISGNKIKTHEAHFEFKKSPPCDKIVTVRQGELGAFVTTFPLTRKGIIDHHTLCIANSLIGKLK
jgi:hypothetical protein